MMVLSDCTGGLFKMLVVNDSVNNLSKTEQPVEKTLRTQKCPQYSSVYEKHRVYAVSNLVCVKKALL